MENKNIAFFCNSISFGGLEMNIVRLANRFNLRGWTVSMIACEESAIFKKAIELNLCVFGIKKVKKYFDISSAIEVKKYLQRNNIKTIACTDNKDLNFIYTLKSIYPLKTLYIQQMQIGVSKKDYYHTMIYKGIDIWVSPLKMLANEVISMTNFSKDKIKIVPLGFDEIILENKIDKKNCRKILDLPENIFLCGLSGRFDKQKGQDFLIECICNLRVKYNIDIGLVLMGEPTKNEGEIYYKSLLKTIKDNNLENRILIRGFRDDVSIFYDAIDLFTLASKSETYGMVTVEAMAKELPVLATKSGGTVELLGNGEFGMLYEPGNINDFCEKFNLIYFNKDLRESLAHKAKLESTSKYTLENQYKLLSDIILS